MKFEIVSAYDEYGDLDSLLDSAARDIARQQDIGITRDRVLHSVAMHEDKVVGAAWIAFDGENYEFDVAVSSEYGRNGIGTALTEAAISARTDLCEGPSDSTMLIPVTSHTMRRILEKQGFVITDVPAKGYCTMAPAAECDRRQKAVPASDLSSWLSP